MGIAEQLNGVRRDFPGCRVAAFADLSSRVVLFASSDARLPQDRLDAFCARAGALLAGPAGQAGAALLGTPVERVLLPEADGIFVFVRSPDEPDEAVICQCDADTDPVALSVRIAQELAALGAGT
jgi:hypothetical protein